MLLKLPRFFDSVRTNSYFQSIKNMIFQKIWNKSFYSWLLVTMATKYCKPFWIHCCLISLICSQRGNWIFYFAKYRIQKIAKSFILLLFNLVHKSMLQKCFILPITLYYHPPFWRGIMFSPASVCLSVCPSVCYQQISKTNGHISIFFAGNVPNTSGRTD